MNSPQSSITFVIAVNDRKMFENNFMASPCFSESHNHQILMQEDFASASLAYNDALRRSDNDTVVFAHQDIILPSSWVDDLHLATARLESVDPHWGVLGCYGMTADAEERGYVYSNGQGILGQAFAAPQIVQTLDEIVLILRKSSKLGFDDRFPYFHLYGADICLTAANRGRKSYAISAFCVHNTQQNLVLPKEFYDCYRALKGKWKSSLPIFTTCVSVTRFDMPMHERQIREAWLSFIVSRRIGATRVADGRALMRQLDSSTERPPLTSTRRPFTHDS
jgi:hypothetical protein